MNLKELRNFDKDDILEMMGLQTKSSTAAMVGGTIGIFAVGLLRRGRPRPAAGAEGGPRAARRPA